MNTPKPAPRTEEPLDSPRHLSGGCAGSARTRYHSLHPFHRMLHGGQLSKGQVQAWALNRYCYQSIIPIKDAVVLSRFRDRQDSAWNGATGSRITTAISTPRAASTAG